MAAVIMDRGIATLEDMAYLERKKYSYFIIERSNTVRDFKNELHDLIGFEESVDKNKSKFYLKKVKSTVDLARVLACSGFP